MRWTVGLLVVGGVTMAALASMVRIVDAPHAVPTAAPRALVVPTVAVAGDAAPITVVPVAGVTAAAIRDSWGDSRADGARRHDGTDIMAPGGTRVVAAADGTVEKLYFSNGGGGITAYIRSPDRRWRYYYAHLAGYAQGLREGMRVMAGDTIGFVGDTGNAGAGNTHLHFGVARMTPAQRWWEGEPVNPYPMLAGLPPRR